MGEHLEEAPGTSSQQEELYSWIKALGTSAELIFSNRKEEHMGADAAAGGGLRRWMDGFWPGLEFPRCGGFGICPYILNTLLFKK